jgi:hypothetical protein
MSFLLVIDFRLLRSLRTQIWSVHEAVGTLSTKETSVLAVKPMT